MILSVSESLVDAEGSHTGELLAGSLLVLALAAFVLAVGLFRRVGKIHMRLGSVELTADSVRKIEQVHEQMSEVLHSVNGVGVDELKLIDQVRELQRISALSHEHQHWTRRSLERIAAELGVTLPPAPTTRAPHLDGPLPPPAPRPGLGSST